MPTKFRNKIFNPNVFEKYLKTLPSTKEVAFIKSGLFTTVNKYKSKMSEQAGGYFVTEPIKGRIGGTPVNYDGNTNIPDGAERDTFYQTKICYGRAMSWGEYDFSSEITGENFKAEAGEVKEYWDERRQEIVLSILKGIFSMSGGVNGQFVTKHTYDITSLDNKNLGADTMNRATQKALGDKKAKFDVMICHSMVSTNLEGLQLLDYYKYNDANGIQRDLTIGSYNGRLVVVDDDAPTTETVTTAPVYSTTISTPATAGDKIVVNGVEYTFVANDTASPADDEIKVGASGTAPQQATNIASKLSITGYTITASSSKVLFTASSGTNPTEPDVKAIKADTTGTLVVTNATDTPAVTVTNYISYIFKKGFFEYEDLGVITPVELVRDAKLKGGRTELISRIREMIVPTLISYVATNKISPVNSDFENGDNWELVNNGEVGDNKVYVDDKLIPLARIISRG